MKAICLYSSKESDSGSSSSSSSEYLENSDETIARESFFSCVVSLYSPSEAVEGTLIFTRYKSKDGLHDQVHRVLGGVVFSDLPFSEAEAQEDIQRILDCERR